MDSRRDQERRSRFPMLIALAVLVMVCTLTLAFVADRLRRRA